MPTAHSATKELLSAALKFMDPGRFHGFRTSATIKSTRLSATDIAKAISMRKFEPCKDDTLEFVNRHHRLPEGTHGVNVFAIPEIKGRRRMITEPHLNALIGKHDLPQLQCPTRLGRRQSLRYARYMVQIDFEAFCDTIRLPDEMRDKYIFRHGTQYYRLCTLPTGARWSVAIGQAVTATIVDIDTPVIIYTMIDNILVAAPEGMEREFTSAVRRILDRIRTANLLTSPDREWLASLEDDELLRLGEKRNVFLGEEYMWTGVERLVRNAPKTVAKLNIALQETTYTYRLFAGIASLIMYALHTTQINPARAYALMSAYRGVYRAVTERGGNWDAPLPHLTLAAQQALHVLGLELSENPWWTIAAVRQPTYMDDQYDVIIYTDASAGGWGAIAYHPQTGHTTTYQQRWGHDTHPRSEWRRYNPAVDSSPSGFFTAKHSAHAEPRAAQLILQQLVREDKLKDGDRVALVTDHEAIVHAQKHLNGFGGIGRGDHINYLYKYTYDLLYNCGIDVTFFYIDGPRKPAGSLSRNFGVYDGRDTAVVTRDVQGLGVPTLENTYSPLCENRGIKGQRFLLR